MGRTGTNLGGCYLIKALPQEQPVPTGHSSVVCCEVQIADEEDGYLQDRWGSTSGEEGT